MGTYVNDSDIRNFFTPYLTREDVSTATLTLYIEVVEDFVEASFFNDNTTTSDIARVPCILLVASKIIGSNSELAKKYSVLQSERFADYSYEIGGIDAGNPNATSLSWEQLALRMLRERTTNKKYYLTLVND